MALKDWSISRNSKEGVYATEEKFQIIKISITVNDFKWSWTFVSRAKLSLQRGFLSSNSTSRLGGQSWTKTPIFCLIVPCPLFPTPVTTPLSKTFSRCSSIHYISDDCQLFITCTTRPPTFSRISSLHRIPGFYSWGRSLNSFCQCHGSCLTLQGCWIYLYPFLWIA